MKIALNFGGFYQSWHDEIVEQAVAYACGLVDEDTGEVRSDELFASINSWEPYFQQYAEAWVDQFNDEVGTSLEFARIDSPREYNFRTDAIMVDASNRDILRIFAYVRENLLKSDALEIARSITTSRDGFIAFYKYYQLFQRENRDLLAECLCDAIIAAQNNSYPWIVEDFEAEYCPQLEVAA